MMQYVLGHHMVSSHHWYHELSGDLRNRIAQQEVILDVDNIRSIRM